MSQTCDLCDTSVVHVLPTEVQNQLAAGYFKLAKCPAHIWFDSLVGRTLHWHHKGHGFEAHSSLNFLPGLLFTTAQVVYIAMVVFANLAPSIQINTFHTLIVISLFLLLTCIISGLGSE